MRCMARLLFALFLVESAFAQGPSTSARVSGYIGSNVCRACHPDIALNFYKNPHYKSVASGKESQGDRVVDLRLDRDNV